MGFMLMQNVYIKHEEILLVLFGLYVDCVMMSNDITFMEKMKSDLTS
jgi:hypothetical protein